MQQLIITYDEQTGNVNVNGPIGNKGLCYLMLECSRDAIKEYADTHIPKQPVTTPNNGAQLTPFVRKAIKPRKR